MQDTLAFQEETRGGISNLTSHSSPYSVHVLNYLENVDNENELEDENASLKQNVNLEQNYLFDFDYCIKASNFKLVINYIFLREKYARNKTFPSNISCFPLSFPSTPSLEGSPSIVNQNLKGLQESHKEERNPWSLIQVELGRVRRASDLKRCKILLLSFKFCTFFDSFVFFL